MPLLVSTNSAWLPWLHRLLPQQFERQATPLIGIENVPQSLGEIWQIGSEA
jgi:hypothetical protein